MHCRASLPQQHGSSVIITVHTSPPSRPRPDWQAMRAMIEGGVQQQATGPLCAGQATRARGGRLLPSLTQTLNEGFAGSLMSLGLCMHALGDTSCELLEHAIVQKGNRGTSRLISISHLSMAAHRRRCTHTHTLLLLHILARHAAPLSPGTRKRRRQFRSKDLVSCGHAK